MSTTGSIPTLRSPTTSEDSSTINLVSYHQPTYSLFAHQLSHLLTSGSVHLPCSTRSHHAGGSNGRQLERQPALHERRTQLPRPPF